MKVHVTKLAAAERQLRAAIRMYFAEEDELAVHTVASAAYRILADLKEDRGRDEVADYYLTTIFYCVRDYRRGTLPSHFTEDPMIMNWIRDMADRLPIKETTEFSDIKARVSPDLARKYWQQRTRISNFLKHADRDPKAHVALDEVDNLSLLAFCLGSYIDLVNDNLGAEGLVFWLYFSVTTFGSEDMPEKYQKMAAYLEELDSADRLAFCSAWLTQLKAPDKRAPE